MKLLKEIQKKESGQALILALILLAVGGLILIPLLAFMGTGLMAVQVYEKNMYGFYAADAGVEDALWKLMNDPPAEYPYSYQVPDVNGMSVDILIEEVTFLYGVEVGEGGEHEDWLDLKSRHIDDPNDPYYLGDYTYELSLTNKHNSKVKIESITISFFTGLDYPDGYQVDGLYDGDIEWLTQGSFANSELTITESGDNQILTWEFTSPRPEIEKADLSDSENPIYRTVSCTFRLIGLEEAPGITAYLVISREDIGTVWEYKPFKITAQADDGGAVVTTVLAGILEGSDTVLIGSWQVE